MRFRELLDRISKKRPLRPSRDFWRDFDRELGQKLDRADTGHVSLISAFLDAIGDLFPALESYQFRRALVTVSLAAMVISFTLLLSADGRLGLYTVASLKGGELVDELVLMDTSATGENIVDF